MLPAIKYDTQQLPDNKSQSLIDLRTALIGLKLDDLEQILSNDNTFRSPKPIEPKTTGISGSFNHSSGSIAYFNKKIIEYKDDFHNDVELQKAASIHVICKLAEGQPQTIENLWRARELALEQTKDDIFHSVNKEYHEKHGHAPGNNVLSFRPSI